MVCENSPLAVLLQSAAVAQWIEYWPPKPRVVGSIPASRTSHRFDAIKFDYLVRFQVLTNSQKAVWPEKDQSSEADSHFSMAHLWPTHGPSLAHGKFLDGDFDY